MKKVVPLSLSLVALGMAAAAGFTVSKINKAEAYDRFTLPTTISLNDNTDSEIREYYSGLNSLAESERQGTNLLKNLKPILKNGQRYYSYDGSGGSDIWKMYEITDRDWVKSPASDIPGYNSSTNTISGYSYGSSASKKGMNPYLHALYVNRDVDNKMQAWQVYGGTGSSHGNNAEWCIDREHIWPKSHGFDNDDAASAGARGDPMHLWPGDSYVNSALHSNYYYGYVDTAKKYTDGKDKYAYDKGNLMGFSKTAPGVDSVFEPQDSDKGDIARAVFYMVARYNNLSGDDTNIQVDNPNLTLTNSLVGASSTGTSTATQTYSLGVLGDLLEWNRLDPPDEWEIHRNNLCYNNYTKNRNPFIDFPQWAEYIWGSSENGTYSATPTGAANPQTDGINELGSALKVQEVGTAPKAFEVGATRTLKAITSDNSQITWSVEDPTIVSIDKTTTASGEEVTVTALKDGKTNVIAKATVDGKEVTKKFNIQVGVEKNFFEENKGWLILLGIGVAVLLIIIIILFAIFGSKKSKKKVKKAITKTVKKTVKNSGKNTSKSSSKSKK